MSSHFRFLGTRKEYPRRKTNGDDKCNASDNGSKLNAGQSVVTSRWHWHRCWRWPESDQRRDSRRWYRLRGLCERLCDYIAGASFYHANCRENHDEHGGIIKN